MSHHNHYLRILLLIVGLQIINPTYASDEYELTIKSHHFDPAVITIPANTKVKLVIKNLDATAEEVESYELNREKIVPPNGQAIVFIGPLDVGVYKFFGEFHQDTAQGQIIVK